MLPSEHAHQSPGSQDEQTAATSLGHAWRRLRLKSQLIVTIVGLGLIPLAASSYLNMRTSSRAMMSQAFDQLESVRELKKNEIQKFFSTTQVQSEALASGPFVIEGVLGLSSAFDRLETMLPEDQTRQDVLSAYAQAARSDEQFSTAYRNRTEQAPVVLDSSPTAAGGLILRDLYVTQNPNSYTEKQALDRATDRSLYTRLHRRYHPFFRGMMSRLSFKDILIVTPDDGTVVYSVRKALDFGTSLKTGAFRDTGIAQIFEQVVATGESAFSDFEKYRPALDLPSAFVATPVMDQGALIGVMIVGLAVDELNAITMQSSGMGQTGHSFLLGPDLTMRSQRRDSTDPSILSAKVDTEASREASAGNSGVRVVTGADGVPVLSAFAPLSLPDLDWSLLVEIDEAEVHEAISPLVSNAIASLVVAGAILLACSILLARLIVRPINDAAHVASCIADGNLESTINTRDGNEINEMLQALARMQAQLRERLESDRQVMQSMSRITQALNNTSAGVLVTDTDDTIVFANSSARRSLAQIPNGPADEQIVGLKTSKLPFPIAGQNGQPAAQIQLGAQTVRASANGVVDANGERLGRVVEWRDWTTEQSIETEIRELIQAAHAGDLSQRLSLTGKGGFFLALSEGMNDLVGIAHQIVSDMGMVLSGLAKGDLSTHVTTQYQGEFDNLKQDANSTVKRLTEIVERVQSGADSVLNGAGELSRSSQDLDRMISVQAANLEQTSQSIGKIHEAVQSNASNAERASTLSGNVNHDAASGREVVDSAVAAMAEIHESSAAIADIISVIDEIAFQTNLLALNASVEAARAGEHGLGFAVVAREVRGLAVRSAGAAHKIKELINDSVDKVDDGSRLVNETGQIFEQIVNGISEVASLVSGISDSSLAQAQSVGNVSQTIQTMDEATARNNNMVIDSTRNAATLDREAAELKNVLKFFTGAARVNSITTVPRRKAS
ncbi:MAG: methyl-accepting chemotaxis protein [Gammaproteobacteria bacterium]